MSCANLLKKICIVGSGNWGSAIAKIIGYNVQKFPKEFSQDVSMYVYEEKIDGKNLSEIINEEHENVRYLPGIKLPENVRAVPDVVKAADNADILIFVVPHQFVRNLCRQIAPSIKPTAIAMSLIKGLDVEDGLNLISTVISKHLGVQCGVLMGANLANEVSQEFFCECTVGIKTAELGMMLKRLFQTDYFKIVHCDDCETIELCGALKNIVATGAGFIDGLGLGNNTKAAVVRLGLVEMIKFAREFYPESRLSTFFESCGIADIITTCYAGRNKRVAEAFAKANGTKTITELEAELLNGQHVQGVPTAAEVNHVLKKHNLEPDYPLFTAIHRICIGEMPVKSFVKFLEDRTDNIDSINSLFAAPRDLKFDG